MTNVHGVLVVDKPNGPTSHDVVARVRRALDTRQVGHAGTLDPEATGVLVVAVREGTKLVPWLLAEDKHYEAVVALGAETDTLDAAGRVVESAGVPTLDAGAVEGALAPFVGVTRQRPPRVSAIKVAGTPMHERARRGEAFEPEEREVVLHRAEAQMVAPDRIALALHCGKGFYVRSLARDLALALGTRGHLASLRRVRSGAFGLDRAVSGELVWRAADGDAAARAEIGERILSIVEAWPHGEAWLDERGTDAARHGRAIPELEVRTGFPTEASAEVLLRSPLGDPVAIAELRDGTLRVVRGFRA